MIISCERDEIPEGFTANTYVCIVCGDTYHGHECPTEDPEKFRCLTCFELWCAANPTCLDLLRELFPEIEI